MENAPRIMVSLRVVPSSGHLFLPHAQVEVVAPFEDLAVDNAKHSHDGDGDGFAADLEAVDALVHDDLAFGYLVEHFPAVGLHLHEAAERLGDGVLAAHGLE